MNNIPNTFDNFEQRVLANGLETKSETNYKGYIIQLRTYPFSGITYKIIKLNNNKRIILKQITYNFYNPLELLNKAKEYINNHEINLINNFNNKSK